jgi:signal transduction histidine kinase
MQTMQQPGGRERHPARLRLWQRIHQWVQQHPVLADVVLVVVLLWLSGLMIRPLSGARHLWSLAMALAVMVPLAWRRRAPFLVFAIITVAAAVQLGTTPELSGDVALLAAFYTVATLETSRRILIAGAVLVAGSVPAAILNAHTGLHVVLVLVLLYSLIVAAGLTGWYVRSRRERLNQLAEQARQLERERDQQAQLATAAERERIAREMHDIVAHNIAVMIALADGAAYTVDSSPQQAAAVMGEVSAAGRSALTEMRRLLGVLRLPAETAGQAQADQRRTPYLPQPTLADVHELLATVRAAGLPTALTVTGQAFALPSSAQLTIYRMIQEALTNTLKHSPGASARISIAYSPGEVELEIIDDGQDAAPGTATPAAMPGSARAQIRTAPPAIDAVPGHGIAGMRERAAVFGGEVSAGPGSGGGWRVHTVLHLGSLPEPDPPASTGTPAGSRNT